jgi:hypothetical protein
MFHGRTFNRANDGLESESRAGEPNVWDEQCIRNASTTACNVPKLFKRSHVHEPNGHSAASRRSYEQREHACYGNLSKKRVCRFNRHYVTINMRHTFCISLALILLPSAIENEAAYLFFVIPDADESRLHKWTY